MELSKPHSTQNNYNNNNSNNNKTIKFLRLGMMKPPNNNPNGMAMLPANVAAAVVLQIDAKNRNMDIDVQCTAKNRINCRKNLLEK